MDLFSFQKAVLTNGLFAAAVRELGGHLGA